MLALSLRTLVAVLPHISAILGDGENLVSLLLAFV